MVGQGLARQGRVRHGMARQGKVFFTKEYGKMAKSNLKVVSTASNGAASVIEEGAPFSVEVNLTGAADLLFHRWNNEAVDAKASAAKNSRAKKTDDPETFVWRDDSGDIAIPGEYVRQSIIHAAKFKQDPRSPRKSAMDLFKAGIVTLTPLASLGCDTWDYLDTRRVTIQRAGINRTRPAMKAGWSATFIFSILTPEYIDAALFQDVLTTAGRLCGIGDFRPTYGRFNITRFEVL